MDITSLLAQLPFPELLPTRDEFLAAHLTSRPTEDGTGECSVCLKPLEKPVQTPCGHVFCAFCLTKWLREHTSCPNDRKELYRETSPADMPVEDNSDTDFDPDSADADSNDDTEEDVYTQFLNIAIEPFSDTRDFAFHFHNEQVYPHTLHFDRYREKLATSYSPDPYDALSDDTPVEIDVPKLRMLALGAIYRLASDSTTDSQSMMIRAMIHGMCRREWLEVAHEVDRFLRTFQVPEGRRRGDIVDKRAFAMELTARLSQFPRWRKRGGNAKEQDWAVETFPEDEEIVRFLSDVTALGRWIVWTAARICEKGDVEDVTGQGYHENDHVCGDHAMGGESDEDEEDLPDLLPRGQV